MPDELVDFQAYLSNLRETVDNILGEQFESKAASSIDTVARAALREILVEIGTAAIQSIGEYAASPELTEHFITMLQRPSHVSVQHGIVVTAFNEEIAGDAVDLFSVPKQHTLTEIAPFIWKYAIYKPGHGEATLTSKSFQKLMDKMPTYDQVIAERIEFWGDRAPYWMLIDKGTAAFGDGDRAYPQFAGTNFVAQFRSLAPRVVARAKETYITNLAESLGAEVEILLKEPKKGGRVVIARIPVNEGSLSVLTSSAGNVFFQIGRRGLTFEQARSIVKRTYR